RARLIRAQWGDREAGVQREIRSERPAANDVVDQVADSAGKHLALTKRQVVDQVAVERTGYIIDAASVVAARVVGVLEEEREASLAHSVRQGFFVTERPEVAQAGVHALGPSVVSPVLKAFPLPLLH